MNYKIALILGSAFAFASHANARSSNMESLFFADFNSDDDSASMTAESFTMDGEFGFVMASGNTNTSSLKGALDAEHETESWNNQYRVEFLYKETEVSTAEGSRDEVTAQRFYSTAQMDFKLSDPNDRLFLFGEYDNNRFSAYQYQAAVAAGWAQKAVNEDAYQLRYSIGPGYGFAVDHDGEEDEENHGFILRASLEYKQQLSTGAKLRQFLSTEANSSVTRSRSETSISAQVMDSLAMKLSFIMNYNSGAEDATKKSLDTETSIALVYQFF